MYVLDYNYIFEIKVREEIKYMEVNYNMNLHYGNIMDEYIRYLV